MLRFDPTPFEFLNGLAQWAVILGAFLLVAFFVAITVALLTGGRKRGIGEFQSHVSEGFLEAIRFSPKRVMAITMLVVRESIRRKALLVFVVFALLFMFGSWFVTDNGERPEMQAVVHITFVLKAISFLTVPVVLLLACWGLPQDIKQRSLHTVVTKPVRRNEVVLGRILGFSLIGSLILGVMAVAGHVWIKRQVPDDAQKYLVSRVPIYGDLTFTDPGGRPTKAGINTGDIWEFRSYVSGGTQASAIWTFEDVSEDMLLKTTDPATGETREEFQLEYNFEAFRTTKGKDMSKGLRAQFHFIKDLRRQMSFGFSGVSQEVSENIAAGNFTEAGRALQSEATKTQADVDQILTAGFREQLVLKFRGLRDLMEPFADENTFEAASEFVETADGVVDSEDDGVAMAEYLLAYGKLLEEHQEALAEHVVDLKAVSNIFEVIEYKRQADKREDELATDDEEAVRDTTYRTTRKRPNFSQSGGSSKVTLDIFDDLTHGGKLRVAVYCMDRGQYLGMARPDLYIRTPDRPFESGYYKAVAGTWMMVILVVVLGVTASTFVKGPVATLLTCTLIVVGLFFHPFLDKLVNELGGKGFGAIESMVRIVKHKNPQVELEDSRYLKVMEVTDKVILGGLWTVYKTVPNFNVFHLAPFVANGFDVPFSAGLARAIAMTLAYFIPCLFIGYFSLRLRELEAK